VGGIGPVSPKLNADAVFASCRDTIRLSWRRGSQWQIRIAFSVFTEIKPCETICLSTRQGCGGQDVCGRQGAAPGSRQGSEYVLRVLMAVDPKYLEAASLP
jgi:hypothetical protein